MSSLRASVLALCLAMLATWPASAHDSRPLYVEITESAEAQVNLTWKTPGSVAVANRPFVSLDESCSSSLPARVDAANLVGRTSYQCPDGLSGRVLNIEYPGYNPSLSTLLRVTYSTGEVQTVRAGPDEVEITLPSAETAGSVAVQYGILGVEHILLGFDHLLFLACLVLIAGTLRRIVITVTGFTIAHSLTLALASLDLVRVPIPPVEAVIALSIVFLATELARKRRDTLTWRYPISVSASFGLLHGFGFASVLADIGLPQREVPVALLSFNLGVEIGQLMFIAVLLPVLWLLGKAVGSDRLTRPVAYAVGALASFWMVERIVGFAA